QEVPCEPESPCSVLPSRKRFGGLTKSLAPPLGGSESETSLPFAPVCPDPLRLESKLSLRAGASKPSCLWKLADPCAAGKPFGLAPRRHASQDPLPGLASRFLGWQVTSWAGKSLPGLGSRFLGWEVASWAGKSLPALGSHFPELEP